LFLKAYGAIQCSHAESMSVNIPTNLYMSSFYIKSLYGNSIGLE